MVATEDPALRVGGIDQVAGQLISRARSRLGGEHQVLVGIGDSLPISEIAVSYEQARQAIRVAETHPLVRSDRSYHLKVWE